MNAIEKLYTVIAQQFPNERITTNQAANAVGLTRGVTSSYLSKLAKQDYLLKTGTRPVYWQVKRAQSAFDHLIGSTGSLAPDIQRAIETIVYPEHGLPILITGPSGSGKGTLARTIYREALHRKILTQTAFFKTIDCTNYKGQPENLKQALQSVITQATADNAQQSGYLYVKNFQALRPADQQHLFTLADQQATTNIRYILSATTTRVDTNQIHFKSTVSQISLVPINDRPFNERVAFVAQFLQQQANQTARTIRISLAEIMALATLQHDDNIRGLRNHIQMICASAYAKTPESDQLIIGQTASEMLSVEPDHHDLHLMLASIVTSALQLTPTVDTLFKDLDHSLRQGEAITEQSFLVLKVLNQIDVSHSKPLLTAFDQIIQTTATGFLTNHYGITFPKTDAFWRNVTNAFSFATLCHDNLTVTKSVQNLQAEIKQRYPRSHYVFKNFLSKLPPSYSQNSYYFLPFFILMSPCTTKLESVKYNAIIIAHGEHTATSIQQIANTLCGNFFFEAFDMPIDVSFKQISSHVQHYLTRQGPSPKGNIILLDMGSLQQMFREVKSFSNQELLVVNNVTTAMALDIGLRVQRNEPFQTIASASQKYGLATNAQYYEGLSNKKNIIVSCMSGVGLSEQLKKLIFTTLSTSLEVIAIDYKKLHDLLKNHDRHFFANTQLILTTTDVSGDVGVDIMNIYNIFDKSSSLELQSTLLAAGESQEATNLLVEKLLRFLSIEGIRGRLQILNPDIVIQKSQDIVAHYENFYNVEFDSRLKLNLYMHLSLMMERMLMSTTESETTLNKATLTNRERDFFLLSSGIFKPLEQKFNIKIQDYEIELLYELLKDYIFTN
ncbi:PRD domain-containing protein [Lactiplantibacillus plantarum]|uniref:PRD domain-containing protein n=1 Tax=Lactiplantibacillus plantarum TaxID=1590 RepID=UPI0032DE2D4F